MSTTALSMKMSLSPTNCRTVPDASVLSMTFGTPSGSARIAAVAMVVPADPPSPSTPASFAAGVRLVGELRRARGGAGHSFAAVGAVAHRVQRGSCELEHALTGNVGRDGRRAERADIDQCHADAPRSEQTADEVGLAAFRVERGEKEHR